MNCQERILRILEQIAGTELATGVSNKHLSDQFGVPPSTISHDLLVLESMSWIERTPARGWWRVTKEYVFTANRAIRKYMEYQEWVQGNNERRRREGGKQ